jgi:uncharacterized oligopeptide transporter (OPT) family protein
MEVSKGWAKMVVRKTSELEEENEMLRSHRKWYVLGGLMMGFGLCGTIFHLIRIFSGS